MSLVLFRIIVNTDNLEKTTEAEESRATGDWRKRDVKPKSPSRSPRRDNGREERRRFDDRERKNPFLDAKDWRESRPQEPALRKGGFNNHFTEHPRRSEHMEPRQPREQPRGTFCVFFF